MTDPSTIADSLKDYATLLKNQLPAKQLAIVEAILIAEEVKRKNLPAKLLISRLRGSAMQFRRSAIFIATEMDMLADSLEGVERRIQ